MLTAALALTLTACHDSQQPSELADPAADYYGNLPNLRNTPHPGLQSELARIVEEGGTPDVMCGAAIPEEQNVAAGLTSLFGKGDAKSLLERTGEFFPRDRFQFEADELAAAIKLLRKQKSLIAAVHRVLKRPESDFRIDFQSGFEADLSFIDTVRTCCRLEALAAAEALVLEDPSQAIDCLGRILRLAACLAAERHPTTRIEAAYCRAEALVLLRAISDHPACDTTMHNSLCALVSEQLDGWPNDAEAWIGDRALGLWVYEMVQAGRLLDVLTSEEIRQFTEEAILADLAKTVQQNVQEDELFYLQAMQRIIDCCSQPYYKRSKLFQAIREELHQNRNSPQFPFVAGRLLLVDVEKGHQIQAQDRANWEAVALALAAAIDKELPPYQVNPLTGKRYEIVHQDDKVTVWNVGSTSRTRDAPIRVRRRTEG
jgi:hypothetical protein